ncbi:MAG: heavy metal translocating P-type ATPase [Capsulimonadaceae bacterium]|nr:heavy metal translocating P-type ATPase [Capsulimonadaceae bacterium]
MPARAPVIVIAGGSERIFCCHGCRNVFQILNASGALAPGNDPTSSAIYQQARDLGLIGNAAPAGVSPVASPDSMPIELSHEGGAVNDQRQCVLRIDDMWCSSCAWLIQHALLRRHGVSGADVSFASDTARVTYRPARIGPDELAATVRSLGYHVRPLSEADGTGERARHRRAGLIRASLTFLFAMNVMMFQIAQYAGYQGAAFLWILLTLTTVVMALAFPIFHRAFQAARLGHATMETLVSLGSLTAYAYSIQQVLTGGRHVYFDTASMLVALVTVGKFIESGVRASTIDALSMLHGLLPRKACVLNENSEERLVSIERLEPGNVVRVRPGERIAADGVVANGAADVDESLMSGESRPVAKTTGDAVTGGTIVQGGALDVRITRVGADGALARMIAVVDEALRRRTISEQRADKISRVFVPVIVILAAATVFAMLAGGHALSEAIPRAVAVLVIACPCALGIATPLAISAAVGAAARKGIIVADPSVFEKLGLIRALVFDKTGTLTEGRFAVHCLMPSDADAAPLVALERLSEHPLGRAITRWATEGEPENVSRFEAVAGAGVRGIVRGASWFAGNARLVANLGGGIPENLAAEANRLQAEGLSVVYWGRDGREVTGLIALGDRIRPGAADLAGALSARGITTHMVSGDAGETVRAAAQALGIETWQAQASPSEKAQWIDDVRGGLPSGALVGMVGDGVNDAPSLARSDVGIAMATGAELASRAAHVTLLSTDPRRIRELIDLAKKATRIIRQNLFWACAYNLVCVPLAMLGYVQPVWAAVAMIVSSFTVIVNARRAA